MYWHTHKKKKNQKGDIGCEEEQRAALHERVLADSRFEMQNLKECRRKWYHVKTPRFLASRSDVCKVIPSSHKMNSDRFTLRCKWFLTRVTKDIKANELDHVITTWQNHLHSSSSSYRIRRRVWVTQFIHCKTNAATSCRIICTWR